MDQTDQSSPSHLTRVVRIDRGHVRFVDANANEFLVPVTSGIAQLELAVGDLVRWTGDNSPELLPRKTRLARATKKPPFTQVLASNVDVVFLAFAASTGARAHVIERLAALGWASGAEPRFLVTKADLASASELDEIQRSVEKLAPGIPVDYTSAELSTGIQEVAQLIAERGTAVVIGHSGIGKSSILNAIVGSAAQSVGSTRARDSKGRHTTTHRELVELPAGGWLIDTPGLRELGMEVERSDLDRVFGDVAGLAHDCRFADCTHTHEPGCAVVAAVELGVLERERVNSMQHLEREAQHNESKRQPQQRDKDREWTRKSREYRRARGH